MALARSLQTNRAAIAASAMLLSSLTHPANILNAWYDSDTDTIVARVAYQGTNPHHTFTLKWDECRRIGSEDQAQVAALLEDSQWNDTAEREFNKTATLSLDRLPCRPAQVSLHTAAGFVYTLDVPAAPKRHED